MMSLVCALAPLVCGVLLAATGAGKLFGRQVARQAAGTVLVRILNDGRRATWALRAVGAVESAVAVALLAAPTAVPSGAAAAVLGAGFTAYLGYAKATAPESSCGCSASDEGPIGSRAFARAGLVVVFGLLTVASDVPWWSRCADRPVVSAVVVLVAAAVLLVLSDAVDRMWLLPLRRTRLKVFGHPLAGAGADVPLAASVELLERSLAWQAASPVVRSGLLEHWDEDGWRILRFTGVHEDEQRPEAAGPDGPRGAGGVHGSGGPEGGGRAAAAGTARPVNVLFALDLTATLDNTARPAVRVTVVDDRTDEIVPVRLRVPAERTVLPLAEPAMAARLPAT